MTDKIIEKTIKRIRNMNTIKLNQDRINYSPYFKRIAREELKRRGFLKTKIKELSIEQQLKKQLGF